MENPKYIDLNDPEAVLHMGINPKGKIYFLSHGYLEMGQMQWLLDMGKALLTKEKEGNAAVVLIDWGGGSSPPYVQAVANIRLVGAITAHVIHMIYEELRLSNINNVHFIGHSLGAHLAGYAGYTLHRDFGLKLGRITGLDPAAPLFTDTDPIVRLDRSDAHFVDIIHTDANPLMKGGLGIHERIGHVDFYPNDGFDNPGCDIRLQDYMKNRRSTLMESMQEFLGCNHIRSYQYFTESILTKCPFMGVTCESFEAFKEGKCSSCDATDHVCMRMGYHSFDDYKHHLIRGASFVKSNKPPVLYLMTGDSKPFCRAHYKVTVRVSGSDVSLNHGGEIGTLFLRLHSNSSKRTTERIKFTHKPMYYEPGFEYSALVPGKDLRDPAFATVFLEYQTNILNPLTWRILASPRIYLDYIIVESLEFKNIYLKLCPLDGSAVLSGENVFHAKYCK
ncbi:pancreatic triacylglycerol lipase-like [Teleopsis dalmanni]|uniref:pancreatic triacylglycerol lipase-like n=1 Tax=Teleopsis dalmanni TaxID=139649 RepID=UPI0018CF7F5A|nr:pancreatic triacylglycerol lipase-like [Teleopsis dalmanni]XP_037939689.1 pancreatic triacylglycerol lipase-like [Teleopsis dalmanni]